MSPELTARRFDVTEREPASRLLEKVDYRKSLLEKSPEKGPTEKVHRRRSGGEGPLEKFRRRSSVGEGPSKKVRYQGGEGSQERVR